MAYKLVIFFLFIASLSAQTLVIGGQVDHPLNLTAADLRKMPRTMISASEHGKEVKFEGVLLKTLLEQAGAPMGARLKGQNMTAAVYFTAKDGYKVVLALAEIDSAFQENQILVADEENGAPLSESQGPFRLVVPEDHKPARWIRMLQDIDVRTSKEGN